MLVVFLACGQVQIKKKQILTYKGKHYQVSLYTLIRITEVIHENKSFTQILDET